MINPLTAQREAGMLALKWRLAAEQKVDAEIKAKYTPGGVVSVVITLLPTDNQAHREKLLGEMLERYREAGWDIDARFSGERVVRLDFRVKARGN